MKYLIAILCTLLCFGLKAQESININASAQIPAINLDVSWHKTTLLIFPAPIRKGMRGDKYVLADQVKDADNILQVKAGQKGFEQSNLNVVTTDGKVYVFNVNYNENAPCLPVYVDRLPPYASVTFKGLSLNGKEIEQYGRVAAAANPFMQKGRYNKYGMELILEGIFIKEDVLFLRYNLKNTTGIKYEPASIRFFIRDKKQSKRTASGDKETSAVYLNKIGTPEDTNGQVIIVAFPRFTIAEGKYFATEIMEKDGDRNPTSRLDQKLLLRCKPLR